MAKYKVHSAVETTVDVPAKAEDGTDVVGKMRVLLVELVAADLGGSINWRERIATNEELAAAQAKFAVDAMIEVTAAPAAA